VYKNYRLDTAILKLCPKENKAFPPSIGIFSPLIKDKPVYLIGHPNGMPMTNDPKIEIYKHSEEVVKKSNRWANDNGFSCGNHYEGIDDPMKILFHCACQEGASGALGVMVMPHRDEPVGVLMLNRGYPGFYYSPNRSFSNTDKENFLIVEQGVLLTSIKNDMESEIRKKASIEDDIELEDLIKLKDEIFSYVMLHKI
jgi:hypothetical protein